MRGISTTAFVFVLLAGCANGGAVEPSSSTDASAGTGGSGAGSGDGGARSGDGGASSSPSSKASSSPSAGGGGSSSADGGSSSGEGGAASVGGGDAASVGGGASSTQTVSASSGADCDGPEDCPASATLCRSPVCSGGACTSSDAARGTACTDAGGTVCDGTGTCVAATCTDGLLDGAEIGVDCGGGTCPGCIDGTTCTQPVDCASGACVGNLCVACGGNGQPCCAGSVCDAAPSTCVDNTSTLWGGTAEECNCGALRAGQVLRIGEARWSCDGRFQLVMQGDGNLVLYFGGSALWASDTAGTPATRTVMQADGNLVVLDDIDQIWWASWTSGAVGAYLAIQDDANLVIYDAGGTVWWASDSNI